MMRSSVARKQFKCVLPEDVLRHLEAEYLQRGWEKPLQMVAGLVALECLSDPMRLTMIRWAVAISQGDVTWEALANANRSRKAEALDQRTLLTALESLMQAGKPRPKKRRPG